jgi:hypothetical protein
VFAPTAHETSPIDQEMLTLGRAEEDIDRLFPEQRGPTGLRKPGKAGPPAADGDKPRREELPKDAPAAGATAASGGDACAVACKALNAMASAAERLCRLSGENDGRCDDARARVRGASGRVKSACPACTVSAAPAAAPAPPKGTVGPSPDRPPPGMPGSSIPIP